MDLWGKGGFRCFKRESKERAREQDMKERVTPSPGLPAVPETSLELTDFRVPDDRVFFVPNVLEGLHHPVADVFYLQRLACTAIPGMVWMQLWVPA